MSMSAVLNFSANKIFCTQIRNKSTLIVWFSKYSYFLLQCIYSKILGSEQNETIKCSFSEQSKDQGSSDMVGS